MAISKDSNRLFFDRLGVRLGHKNMDDWYNVKTQDVYRYGGKMRLRRYFRNSVIKALRTVYPDHKWMTSRFYKIPDRYWKELNNPLDQKQIIDCLGAKLMIKTLDDWYRTSLHQVQKLSKINSSETLIKMLKSVYPKHHWEITRLSGHGRSVKSSQRELLVAMKQIFPKFSIYEDFKHSKLQYFGSTSFELDVYVPEIELALEYQGAQHYSPKYWVSDFSSQKQRDQDKKSLCKKVCTETNVRPSRRESPWWTFPIGGISIRML